MAPSEYHPRKERGDMRRNRTNCKPLNPELDTMFKDLWIHDNPIGDNPWGDWYDIPVFLDIAKEYPRYKRLGYTNLSLPELIDHILCKKQSFLVPRGNSYIWGQFYMAEDENYILDNFPLPIFYGTTENPILNEYGSPDTWLHKQIYESGANFADFLEKLAPPSDNLPTLLDVFFAKGLYLHTPTLLRIFEPHHQRNTGWEIEYDYDETYFTIDVVYPTYEQQITKRYREEAFFVSSHAIYDEYGLATQLSLCAMQDRDDSEVITGIKTYGISK